MAGSTSTLSQIFLNISRVTAPGLRSVGISDVRSMMVDSTPIPTAPPSIIISILPFISSNTWLAFVGEGLPEVFALGAAIGTPAASIRALAISLPGSLTATVSRPPLVA